MRIIKKILRNKSIILGTLSIILNLSIIFNTNLMKINLDYKDGFSSVGIADPADKIPPTISISNPNDGDTVTGTVLINTTANDNVGVTMVEFYIDNYLQPPDMNPPYIYTWTTPNYINGTHTLKVIAYDAAGNTDEDTCTVTVDNVDTAPPTVWILNPSHGSTIKGTVMVTTMVSDNVGVTKVDFFIDNVLQISDINSPFDYNWNTNIYTDGSHEIKAIAYDAVGNVYEETCVINVDNNIGGSITIQTMDNLAFIMIIFIVISVFVGMGIIGSVKHTFNAKKTIENKIKYSKPNIYCPSTSYHQSKYQIPRNNRQQRYIEPFNEVTPHQKEYHVEHQRFSSSQSSSKIDRYLENAREFINNPLSKPIYDKEMIFLELRCPNCKKYKKIALPKDIIESAKNIATISIPNNLICEHHFQAYVDKNLDIRGYQKVDFNIDNTPTSKSY